MLQLHYVRCFVAVAQELHFGRAAARLGLTQAPLSRNIQQLEWTLGVVLLERQQQALKLTAAGRAFLPEALHLLEVAQATELTIRDLHHRAATAVKLGYVAGAAYDLVPRILRGAQQAGPELEIILQETTDAEAMAALRSGRLDLAIVRAPFDGAGLESRCIQREPLLAAVPSPHPLAGRSRLTLADFHGQPFVMYRPGGGGFYYELLSYAFHAAGVVPRRVLEVRKTHTILGLVARGIGLAILPASTARARYLGVATIPVDLPPHVISELHLIWQRQPSFNQSAAARLAGIIAALPPPAAPLPAGDGSPRPPAPAGAPR